MFPTISEYNKAIVSDGSHVFRSLYNLSFTPSRTIPVKIFAFGSGSYAVVFKANDGIKQYAIRCFISTEDEYVSRNKKISKYLKNISDSWFTNFELYDNEMKVNGQYYPVIKMDWVEGQLINNYVNQILNNNHAITELQEEIISVSKSLEQHKIGHGDIQCGNLLICKDSMGQSKLKLIDYDGMYIPEFKYKQNLERGRSEFQHPKRTQNDFNETIDRFAFWVIVTALEALKYDKSLWLEVMQGGFNTLDNFLFTGDDFRHPNSSKLFIRLLQLNSPSLNFYVDKLKHFCVNDYSIIEQPILYNLNDSSLAKTFTQSTNVASNTKSPAEIAKEGEDIHNQTLPDNSKSDAILKFRTSLKNNTTNKIEKLESLKKLLDSGAINELELNKLKNEVLGIEKPIPNTTQNVPQKVVKKKFGLGKAGYLLLTAVCICLIYLVANYFLNRSVKADEVKMVVDTNKLNDSVKLNEVKNVADTNKLNDSVKVDTAALVTPVANDTNSVCYLKSDGKYILVDSVTMKPINQDEYEHIFYFGEGLASVERNGKWGYIDKTGREVLPFKHDDAGNFIEGLASVKLNNKWGVIDKTGREVVPIKYDYEGDFSEGLASVERNDKWGIIDKTGTEVLPFIYELPCNFSEGLANVTLNGKCGYIDKTGTEVVPFKYDEAGNFSEGLANVALNGKWGYIDKTGTEVVPFKYDFAHGFHEGLASVELNSKWGFIDKAGIEIVPLKYDFAYDFHEGLASVKLNGKWGFIDKTGTEVLPFKYYSARDFHEGLGIVELNGKVFYIDKMGREYREQ
jgi:hypothetical protein